MAKSILETGRDLVDKAKQETAEAMIGQALGLLGDHPEKGAALLLGALDKISSGDHNQEMMISWLRNWAQNGPGTEFIRRTLGQVHPRVRKRYVGKIITSMFFRSSELSRRVLDETGVNPPTTFLVSPTMRCNYRCVGCYAGNYMQADDLPPEVLDRVFTEAKQELGIKYFILTGGEPFIYPALLDLFDKHSDCAFQVYTNGSFLNPQMCDKLLELGNVCPCISIEGTKELTDQRRGAGAYDRVMKAMDNLREKGLMFAFSATPTRLNVETLISDEFMDLMIEKGCAYGWYFAYMPIGKDPDMDYMPTPEQRNQLRIGIRHQRATKPIIMADFWGDAPPIGGCIAAGRNYFHINNKGDVEPCIFCHFSTHNVKTSTLKEALKAPLFSTWRDMQPFNHNLLRPCPIIDNPKMVRYIIEKTGAKPTHEGAESLLTDLVEPLEQYSKHVADTYTSIWDKEYKHWAEDWAASLHGDKYTRLSDEGDPEKIK